ncbi:lung seven transmembrane receptor-domain-containing protein [Lineolata rhizophorae]|uniref:Lung seven transmembrane receptor-domain-containing protein n=1 Tax=Lineolata rhizophorae TaxID=578093 RepID=A0A6A6NPR1_9PEZI|nr:lung seven transmembrane receptor-domain-containing protein [Lineolata rhizophorae]
MPSWTHALLALLAFLCMACAAEIKLDQSDENRQRCSGMYSRKSWGGATDPYILAKFVQAKHVDDDADPLVSLIMFEWKDEYLLGKPSGPDVDPNDKQYVCTDSAVDAQLCTEKEKGEYILADDADAESDSLIITKAIHLKSPDAVNYPVRKTGYYCVITYSEDTDYEAIVEFRNAYGELPAAQIAKLPFYGGLTIVYAVVGVFWAFLYFQNRHDILAVQNYITAILGFLVLEMLMTWGFYDYQNRHGMNFGAKVLMIVVSILNAFRNSFSFFLLLIVCMGYGVVKPSLGRTMTVVRYLALAHFVFGVIYAVGSLTIHPDDAGPLVLLVILPLSATLTAFYIWTLSSLNLTMKDLVERRQTVKAMMYKKLWWCILGSIIVIFAFFFFNSMTFAGVGNADFAPTHWQTRWFVLDGWLNIVYLVDVSFVAYLWRPTANNRRFAMSDEIAQDDEGFEIASVRDSFDEESGSTTPQPKKNTTPSSSNTGTDGGLPPPPYSAAAGSSAAPDHAAASSSSAPPHPRDVSPLPAPKPQKPVPPPRESLDGDTIFAVGEEDKWSDDEDEDDGSRAGERERLTR